MRSGGQTEGINDSYKAADMQVKVWTERFEVEGREVFDLRNEIISVIGLDEGEAVADVGAGTGLFTPLLAQQVGANGKVYAVDIIPKFIAHIEEKVASRGLTQVQAVLSSETSISMPAGSVDMIFTSDAYHHFVHYDDMLASMHLALKPGGELVIVEFDIEAKDVPQRLIDHVAGTKGEFTQQIEANGFELIEDFTLPAMKQSFMRRFKKK